MDSEAELEEEAEQQMALTQCLQLQNEAHMQEEDEMGGVNEGGPAPPAVACGKSGGGVAAVSDAPITGKNIVEGMEQIQEKGVSAAAAAAAPASGAGAAACSGTEAAAGAGAAVSTGIIAAAGAGAAGGGKGTLTAAGVSKGGVWDAGAGMKGGGGGGGSGWLGRGGKPGYGRYAKGSAVTLHRKTAMAKMPDVLEWLIGKLEG
jgi:hypothetical protein